MKNVQRACDPESYTSKQAFTLKTMKAVASLLLTINQDGLQVLPLVFYCIF